MQNNLPAWGLALATCAPLLAVAQPATTTPPRPSPQLSYQSAFAAYKPYQEASLANWRELNATVGGAPGGPGGHAGHSVGGMAGREVAVPPASPASAAMPIKPVHDDHPAGGGKP